MWPNKERLREKKTYTNTAEAKKEEKKTNDIITIHINLYPILLLFDEIMVAIPNQMH